MAFLLIFCFSCLSAIIFDVSNRLFGTFFPFIFDIVYFRVLVLFVISTTISLGSCIEIFNVVHYFSSEEKNIIGLPTLLTLVFLFLIVSIIFIFDRYLVHYIIII